MEKRAAVQILGIGDPVWWTYASHGQAAFGRHEGPRREKKLPEIGNGVSFPQQRSDPWRDVLPPRTEPLAGASLSARPRLSIGSHALRTACPHRKVRQAIGRDRRSRKFPRWNHPQAGAGQRRSKISNDHALRHAAMEPQVSCVAALPFAGDRHPSTAIQFLRALQAIWKIGVALIALNTKSSV